MSDGTPLRVPTSEHNRGMDTRTWLITAAAVSVVLWGIRDMTARAARGYWILWQKPDGQRNPEFMFGESAFFWLKEGKPLRTRSSNPDQEALRRRALRWVRIAAGLSGVSMAIAVWMVLALARVASSG